MKEFQTIEYSESGKLAELKLNRPEKLNALNEQLITELTELFNYLKDREDIVILKLEGKGKSFCAGADIEWLDQLRKKSVAEIESAFMGIAYMLEQLYSLPQIIVALAHGSVYGGGLGLIACSDFVISTQDTRYSFSEINLGLIPATISPYVIRKIGQKNAKNLFYSGECFDDYRAQEIGLIDRIATDNTVSDSFIKETIKKPHPALKSMKKLLRNKYSETGIQDLQKENSRLIAELIKTKETQELFNKFLNR